MKKLVGRKRPCGGDTQLQRFKKNGLANPIIDL